MSEKSLYVPQCDVCSHPARAEIDSLLLQKALAEKKAEKSPTFAEIVIEAIKLIEDKYPTSKRVTEVSIRNHYHNHELTPGMNPVDIDYDQQLVRVGSVVIPMRDWVDGVRIAWTIALWNITQNPSLLGPTHFIKLSQVLREIGGTEDDEVKTKLRELLTTPPDEKAKGALVPPDGKLRKKPKNPGGGKNSPSLL